MVDGSWKFNAKGASHGDITEIVVLQDLTPVICLLFAIFRFIIRQ